MKITLLGAPFDGCGPKFGSRLGPAAVRFAGLQNQLANLGHEVHDLGDLDPKPTPKTPGHLNVFEGALPVYRKIKTQLRAAMPDSVAMMIGGDHSLSIGSISAALEHYPDLAVLWIDAHGDINTPATSPSSNLHGMPVAALLRDPSGVSGIQDEQWNQILTEIVPTRGLQPNRIGWIGLRDLDSGEQDRLLSLPEAFIKTMMEVDIEGIPVIAEQVFAWLDSIQARHLWISFDVDVFDPVFAPGTGTMVRGGLTYREGHLLAELLSSRLRAEKTDLQLVGLDLVEVNPSIDQNNVTAITGSEWVASLFGKRILPERGS